MRLLGQVYLCCLLAGGHAMAQRGGGGLRGGAGGGNSGASRGGFIGGTNLNPGIGPIRAGLVSPGFPNGVVTANGVGFPSNLITFPFGLGPPTIPLVVPNGLVTSTFSFPSNLVSFPFGLGPPSIPLVVPNSTGFPNGFGVLNFDNGLAFNRGFNSASFGMDFGFGNVGLPFAGPSYGPAYDYQRYASYQPSPNVALILYSPQPVMQTPSAERTRPARPLIHEYDQSGREIPSAGSLSHTVAQADPPETGVQPLVAERGRSVIREYDESGREIPPVGFRLYLIAFGDHTIRTAISYRVDGNSLNYLTPDREQKAVPLKTVNRSLSIQLNRERQVPFDLPPQ